MRRRNITGNLMYTLEPADENLPAFDVLVEYSMTPYDPGNTYGPAENCYPPEGGEIEILSCTTEDGAPIDLETDWPSEYAAVLEQITDDNRE